MTRLDRAGRAAGQPGMTVVELMIAVVILGVVVAAAFSVSYSIMNSYREHRRAINVERSTRGAMAVLSDAARNVSPGVPNGDITDLVGCEVDWKAMRVDNRSDAADALDLVYARGGVVTSTRADFDQNSTQILVEERTPANEPLGLRAGDQVLVTDLVRGHLVTITGTTAAPPAVILDLAGAAGTLCPSVTAFSYPARTSVIRVQKARFEVDTTGLPVLTMDRDGPAGGSADPEAVAEGIEDLQVALGVDRNDDGVLIEIGAAGDDDDWAYNHPGDTDPDPIAIPRALRLTVTARTVPTTSGAISRRPAAEDRPQAAQADGFRRRSLSTTVELRNLQGSP